MGIIDTFSVLNYQGSKKLLLDFIHQNVESLLEPESTILDIFSGTCSVGYSFKAANTIYANDSEYYAYVISRALLNSRYENPEDILNEIKNEYLHNFSELEKKYLSHMTKEKEFITSQDSENLNLLYQKFPTIWNSEETINKPHSCYELFVSYYSGTYFGITQSAAIDSIRFAAEKYKNTNTYYALLTALFYAMKESVFSKDGHMAQPLSPHNNSSRMLKLREKDIYFLFEEKLTSFFSNSFVCSEKKNKSFNMDFKKLLLLPEIRNEVSLIYADPPYTDMQYSRYYHLLNTVALYNYPTPSIKNGKYTKGLYTEGRFQSKLSQKSSCFDQMKDLIQFSHENKKHLAISFAYPANTALQKTDRYVMNIEDLISLCRKEFSSKNVCIETLDYKHSNNRNNVPKKVVEYLIVCKGK